MNGGALGEAYMQIAAMKTSLPPLTAYFIPLGMMLKAAAHAVPAGSDSIGIAGLLWNLLPVIAGNIVGGSVLVALVYHVIYRRGASSA